MTTDPKYATPAEHPAFHLLSRYKAILGSSAHRNPVISPDFRRSQNAI